MHPVTASWFAERYGAPTEIQRRVWPIIAEGQNALFTAPTGSGKTLAAFLYSIDRLLTGAWESGRLVVLYVSPLKALNNDIRRNLTEPLAELSERFRAAGHEPPDIRALTRSGDTPNEERRRMLRRPPEILITTPESLNVLLTSKSGAALLGSVQKIILDEIHAIAGTKRGTHLITAVERVERLHGAPIQRIAVSATVRPVERIAAFVAGYEPEADAEATLHRRPIEIVRGEAPRRPVLTVEYADPLEQPRNAGENEDPSPWVPVIERIRERLHRNRSTLIFTTNRRDAEKVAALLNEAEDRLCAYPHHGSLSLELRREVESRMKAGELEAIVATTSLELGIDIGSIDEVVLLRTPYSAASAVQMIGRSGHRVGAVSRGTFVPFFPRDLLNALVMRDMVAAGDIEELSPPEGPLDILAQVIVSMTAHEEWDIDELYQFMRRSYPYRSLDRGLFENTVDMLAGRYADSHLRELEPRIFKDALSGRISGRPGVDRVLYHSGGTIPDRGYYELRVVGSEAKLGELDEEFVWERRLGEVFVFGNQKWRIREITDRGVRVEAAAEGSRALPFWRGEPVHRSFHWSAQLLAHMERLEKTLAAGGDDAEAPAAGAGLLRDLSADARDALFDFLEEQRRAGAGLPHRHQVVIEETAGRHAGGVRDIVVHTLWGGRVNYPLALLLKAELTGDCADPKQLVTFADDDAVLVQLPSHGSGEEVQRALYRLADHPLHVHKSMQQVLEGSGFFAARFRENAGRALLLPRAGFDTRTPLWLNRLRARNILAVVAEYPDFPMVVETWRTCLQDFFDLESLSELLTDVAAGSIRVAAVQTENPSPFARDLVWQGTNVHMYELDQGVGPSGVSADAIRSAVGAGLVHRRIPTEIINETDSRLKREEPDYAPRPGADLADWVRARVVLPAEEWDRLVAAVAAGREEEGGEAAVRSSVQDRVSELRLPGTESAIVAHVERRKKLEESATAADETELRRLIYEFVGFYAAVEPSLLGRIWGVSPERIERIVAELEREGELVRGHDARSPEAICRNDVYEILLRRTRRRGRAHTEPKSPDLLPLFSAVWQGVVDAASPTTQDSAEALLQRIEQLSMLPLPTELLEERILPARVPDYRPADLDDLTRRDELVWFAAGRERIVLALPEDRDVAPVTAAAPTNARAPDTSPADDVPAQVPRADELFPARRGRFSFWDIHDAAKGSVEETEAALYDLLYAGVVSADTLQPLRRRRSSGAASTRTSRHSRRASTRGSGRRARPSAPPASSAYWYRLASTSTPASDVEATEAAKDRARIVLDRYGIVFRERLRDEAVGFRWGDLVNALRLLELAGEVYGGYFVHGVSGLQFAGAEALELLSELSETGSHRQEGHAASTARPIFQLSAADPASLAGMGLTGLSYELPARQSSTIIVYRGSRPAVIARRNGKDLRIAPEVAAEDPDLPHLFSFAEQEVSRAVRPASRFVVEEINGEAASHSPYAASLQRLGFHRDHTRLVLWARRR